MQEKHISYGTMTDEEVDLPRVSSELESKERKQEKPNLTCFQKFKTFMRRHGPLIWRATLLIGIIIFFAVLVSLLTRFGVMTKILNWVNKTGYYGLIIFAVLLILSCTPIVSFYTIVAIVAGISFGIVIDFQGFLYKFQIAFAVLYPTAVIGSVIGYFVAKKFCQNYLEKQLFGKYKTVAHATKMIEKHAFKIIILLRYSPLPYGLVNGVCASTDVKLWRYIAASILGVPGDMAVNIFVGTTVKTINDAVAGGDTLTTAQIIILVVQIGSAVLLVIILGIIGRVAYKQEEELENVEKGEKEEKTKQSSERPILESEESPRGSEDDSNANLKEV